MKLTRGLCVVKVGGSVARTQLLSNWLEILIGAAVPIVVVPGGGAFADEVREAQKQQGFDDRIAHDKALLAMDRMAEEIAARDCCFKVARGKPDIADCLEAQLIPVWAPHEMCAGCKDIPASWSVTSDSLAVWLCGKTGAKNLLLIKSTGLAKESATAEELSDSGLIDIAFPEFLRRGQVDAFLFGPDDQYLLKNALAGKTCEIRAIGLA